MSRLLFSSTNLEQSVIAQALEALHLPTLGLEFQPNKTTFHYELPEGCLLSAQSLQTTLKPLAKANQLDYAILESHQKAEAFKVLVMDMDSTLITIECIDEIADFVGKKAEVAAITEAAMRGEITDFSESLTRRVALLEGVPESALEAVYNERLHLSPGAEQLIEFAKNKGWKTVLVSGGFTFFTERLKNRLALDYARANTLDIVNGHLTGKVLGPIIDAQAKQNTLLEICQEHGLQPTQAIAIGDGANDLKMMEVAGLSVAYKAKPAVQAKARLSINFNGLDALTTWL